MGTVTCSVCYAIISIKNHELHLKWHDAGTKADEIFSTPMPVIPVEYQHTPVVRIEPVGAPPIVSIEGDVGTWSHCGKRAQHGAHLHDVFMTGEAIYDVHCNGSK